VKELSYDEASARHYGLSIAILAGDILQGWSTALLSELSTKGNVDPDVTIFLIQELALRVQGTLVEGETLDIQYSRYPLDLLNEDLIVRMLWKKTGALYEFAGMAGALIGLGLPSPTHKLVRAISAFAGKCGIAFQLQDDILGIVGQEELLGKPIGSDIREGKRTVIMYHALKRANDRQRAALLEVLGNEHALENDVRDVQGLLRQLGAIEYTKKLARSYVEEATQHLDSVPVSQYTDLLYAWADLMIERDF